MTPSSVIPTRSRVPAVLSAMLPLWNLFCIGVILGIGILAGLAGLAVVLRVDPGSLIQRSYEAGREAATSEAMESIGDVVGSAYATGYRTGLQATCKQGAPL